jgi:hypothetical protein
LLISAEDVHVSFEDINYKKKIPRPLLEASNGVVLAVNMEKTTFMSLGSNAG